MDTPLRWPLIAALVIAVAGGAYYTWSFRQSSPAPAAQPLPQPIPEAPAHYPVPAAAAEAPLPALDASDAAVGEALAGLFGVRSLPALFYPERIIRRFVATVDALPRRQVPQSVMPLRPAAGSFQVAGNGDTLHIDPANAARYARYLDLASHVDAARLVDVYVRFYPLCQQAYVELGYPKGYFNDRLIAAIDDLLAAPQPAVPTALIQPKVLYLYADDDLEGRSAGQKMLMLIGGSAEDRVKTLLRAVRAEIVKRGV
jgi:hypothetical protein